MGRNGSAKMDCVKQQYNRRVTDRQTDRQTVYNKLSRLFGVSAFIRRSTYVDTLISDVNVSTPHNT